MIRNKCEAYDAMENKSEIYILKNFDHVERIFGSIMREFEKCDDRFLNIGFDLEWKPQKIYRAETFALTSPTSSENPVALMQISIRNGDCICTYLIRMIEVFGRGSDGQYRDCALFRLLANTSVLKYGVGITYDAKKLERDYSVRMSGVVELGELIQGVLIYDRVDNDGILSGDVDSTDDNDKGEEHEGSAVSTDHLQVAAQIPPSASLQTIVELTCGARIPKDKRIQCGDWEAVELSAEQITYAASDSYHALVSFESILRIASVQLCIGCDETETGFSLAEFLSGKVDSGGGIARTSNRQNQTSVSKRRDGTPMYSKSAEKCLSSSKNPIYDSCALLSKAGDFLSYCDRKRLEWYLKKGLATELDSASITKCVQQGVIDSDFLSGSGRAIALNFEAGGPGNLHDSYKRQMLRNVCVVCGVEEDRGALQLLHHHVVPKAYRKAFPTCMVSKNNHDIVPMCKPCKARVANVYSLKMQRVEEQWIDDRERERVAAMLQRSNRSVQLKRNFSKVKTLCLSLMNPDSAYEKKIRESHEDGSTSVRSVPVSEEKVLEIKEGLINSLKRFVEEIDMSLYAATCDTADHSLQSEAGCLNTSDTSSTQTFLETFKAITEREVEYDKSSSSSTGGNAPTNMETLVVSAIIQPYQIEDDPSLYTSRLQEFEVMWRQFFVETIRPQYMPEHWSVDYKHIDNKMR